MKITFYIVENVSTDRGHSHFKESEQTNVIAFYSIINNFEKK